MCSAELRGRGIDLLELVSLSIYLRQHPAPPSDKYVVVYRAAPNRFYLKLK